MCNIQNRHNYALPFIVHYTHANPIFNILINKHLSIFILTNTCPFIVCMFIVGVEIWHYLCWNKIDIKLF